MGNNQHVCLHDLSALETLCTKLKAEGALNQKIFSKVDEHYFSNYI